MFTGSGRTWTSFDPTVMAVTQTGIAFALSPGTASIVYISPGGVEFSKWVIYVHLPGI
jgi:uncharacterized protein YjdB